MRPAHPDTQRILHRLEPLPDAGPSPALVLLSGLPGVGKSTFARSLATLVPIAIVATDDVRKALVERPQYTDAEHARVFRVAYTVLAEVLHRGVSTVFDATNLQEDLRRRVYRVARDAGARLVVVAVTAPSEVVRQRMEGRAYGANPLDRSDATWDVYLRFAATCEPIRRQHHLADTSGDIEGGAAGRGRRSTG